MIYFIRFENGIEDALVCVWNNLRKQILASDAFFTAKSEALMHSLLFSLQFFVEIEGEK
jgi:hypothetical protein